MSRAFGHPLMFMLGKRWPKIYAEKIVPFLSGLDLELVGGLADRGWTIHDIDVIGNINDVPKFFERIRRAQVKTLFTSATLGTKNILVLGLL